MLRQKPTQALPEMLKEVNFVEMLKEVTVHFCLFDESHQSF